MKETKMGKWIRHDEDVLLDTVVRTGPSKEGQMPSKSWDGVSHVAIGGKDTGGRGRAQVGLCLVSVNIKQANFLHSLQEQSCKEEVEV